MSSLIDYLNKVEKDVEKWPTWKKKSLKEAFKVPSFNESKCSNKRKEYQLIEHSKFSLTAFSIAK